MFEVIPAIDIRGGRCVRLYQGDYGRETVFSEDPVAVARQWENAGASRLHVVDLDGARAGRSVHGALIGQIIRSVSIPVQVGGGLRREAEIAAMVEAGAARVVLGTAALKAPELLAACIRDYGGERVVVAVDARAGRVATDGWMEQTSVTALDLAIRLAELGIKRLLYTDIARDGTLSGPNAEAIRELVTQSGLAIIASGGVSRASHLIELKDAGAEAAIVGRALYNGDLSLAAALAAVREPAS